MTDPIQKLMAKEVDRKQFLLHIGAAVLTVAGVSGILKALTEPISGTGGAGYGSSPYGGGQDSDRPRKVS